MRLGSKHIQSCWFWVIPWFLATSVESKLCLTLWSYSQTSFYTCLPWNCVSHQLQWFHASERENKPVYLTSLVFGSLNTQTHWVGTEGRFLQPLSRILLYQTLYGFFWCGQARCTLQTGPWARVRVWVYVQQLSQFSPRPPGETWVLVWWSVTTWDNF